MKLLALVLFLGLSFGSCLGHDVPELKAVLAQYDMTKFAQDEPLREKFVMELATLRWKLAQHNNEGWEDVDAELRRHPAPPNTVVFRKARVGKWLSPRHDYLYLADGTSIMDPDLGADSSHGTWLIKGNRYFEPIGDASGDGAPYTIILLDAKNFIYSQGSITFYEKRPGPGGLPLRRDDPVGN